MVVLELYSKSIKVKYKNYLCSKATTVVLISAFLSITFPFIVSYNSKGFWLKYDTFYEQPDIRFRGEYLFIGYTNNVSFPIVCNNFQYYQFQNNRDSCIVIKIREIDQNYDGKIDKFLLKIILTLPENINILYFDLIIPIDYKLHTTCPLNMQAIILIQEVLNIPINVININSVLRLSQKFSLLCSKTFRNAFYNKSVIQPTKNINNYQLKSIMLNYSQRNLTTYLSDIHRTYGIAIENKFEMHVNIIYPEHKIYYKTSFWQIIKWAWIQYLSVYIVFSWFLKKIKDYIFDKHLVLFYKVSPINNNL